MLEIRIVCAHDAVNLAEVLTRLLEAEDHRVRLSYGRQALHDLEEARPSRGLVLLIWSPNARSQNYMIDWARKIEPVRLIEIAHGTSDWQQIKRVSPVIDFTNWGGQRGARCWKLLNERLDAVMRRLVPQKPPLRTLATIGAGLAAVSGAALFGLHATTPPQTIAALTEDMTLDDPATGIGGPLSTIEPASMDDDTITLRHYPDLALIDAQPATTLADLPELEFIELRDPTLLERLNAYNPLRRDDDNSR